MKKHLIVMLAYILASSALIPGKILSQMKDDGKYNTVYLENLCNELEQNPGALVLDVRTPGEFDDTSHTGYLNVGRFKNAVNIELLQLETRLSELETYKDKKIYVYCSHSNRSRYCSSILIDNGFKKVYNINGGISEWVLEDMNCANGIYATNLPYKLYSPQKVKEMIGKNNVQLVDIRPKDEYLGKSTDELKNAGRIRNSINIPYDDLEIRLSEIDKSKDIILYDFDCKLSPSAAKILAEKGFTNTGILIFGLISWINTTPSGENNLMENLPGYKNLSVTETLAEFKSNNPDVLILDIRPASEFNNKDDEMKNIGHLKNAVNIPVSDLSRRIGEIANFKDRKVIVYDFTAGSSKSPEACRLLVQYGFTNVNNAFCGLYKIEWSKKNIKGFDFPGDNIVN